MKGQICWDDISEGKAGNGGGCGFEDGVDGGLLREVQVCCYTNHFMLGIEHKCGVKGDQDTDRIMSHLLSAAQIRPGASPCLILPFWLQAPSKRNTPLVV